MHLAMIFSGLPMLAMISCGLAMNKTDKKAISCGLATIYYRLSVVYLGISCGLPGD
jgi:hypothetical protein